MFVEEGVLTRQTFLMDRKMAKRNHSTQQAADLLYYSKFILAMNAFFPHRAAMICQQITYLLLGHFLKLC